MKRVLLPLAAAIALPEIIGVLGSVFTAAAIPLWYASLIKPFLSPPNWVFGPVWTLLYALMGVSSFLIWQKGWQKPQVRFALGWYLCQLLLNLLWSIVFFALQSTGGAVLCIFVLLLAILVTMREFFALSKTATWLLLPYVGWVSFAAYLNIAFWLLNG